jgi:hypothetical protein
MRSRWAPLLAALVSSGLCLAGAPERWIPEHCLEIATDDPRTELSGKASEAEARWNQAYRRGFRAIERREYDVAEQQMCRALFAASRCGPRDWRFAETLDELGLIAFTLRDYDLAERVQGAAIAEMLLAVGPHGEPFRDQDASEQAPIRPDCRSGINVYTTRLGWIHERVSGRITTSELGRAPWRIFAAGYLPLDPHLARRLDWLVSQYLLEENLVAADELTDLQRQILGQAPSSEH